MHVQNVRSLLGNSECIIYNIDHFVSHDCAIPNPISPTSMYSRWMRTPPLAPRGWRDRTCGTMKWKCEMWWKELTKVCLEHVFKCFVSASEPKAQVHYCDHALFASVRPFVCLSLTFHILDFFSKTTEKNMPKLDRKQELNVLYQVCVFGRPAFDWLRHFRLILWIYWNGIWQNLTESILFDKTWQKASFLTKLDRKHPLPSLCFFGQLEKQDGRPSLWLAETF